MDVEDSGRDDKLPVVAEVALLPVRERDEDDWSLAVVDPCPYEKLLLVDMRVEVLEIEETWPAEDEEDWASDGTEGEIIVEEAAPALDWLPEPPLLPSLVFSQ